MMNTIKYDKNSSTFIEIKNVYILTAKIFTIFTSTFLFILLISRYNYCLALEETILYTILLGIIILDVVIMHKKKLSFIYKMLLLNIILCFIIGVI